MKARAGGATALLLCALGAAQAAAQAPPVDTRAALRMAADRALLGDHAGAVSLLVRARETSSDPRVELALAESLAAIGRLAGAQRRLSAIVRAAEHPIVVAEARRILRSLDPRLPRVLVRVEGRRRTSLRLRVDGALSYPVDAGPVTLRLDPGEHALELVDARGVAHARAELTVDEGARETVTLRPVDVAEPTVRGTPEPRPPATPSTVLDSGRVASEGGGGDAWVPWAVGAAGAAVAVATLVIVLVVASAPSPTPGDADPITLGGAP